MKKPPKKFSYVFKSLIILQICIYGKIFGMITWLGSAFLFMFMLGLMSTSTQIDSFLNGFFINQRLCNLKPVGFNIKKNCLNLNGKNKIIFGLKTGGFYYLLIHLH